MIQEVSVGAIEETLNAIWEEGHSAHAIRASLFNLIIYADSPERIEHLQIIIQSIIEKFPCRLLFIQTAADDSIDKLKVTVAARTSSNGDTPVVCDEIILKVPHNQAEIIPYIIIPHLIADLPIYLIWGGDPTKTNGIFNELQSIMHRVIFDGTYISDLKEFAFKMLKKIEETDIHFTDISWEILESWRDAFIQIFDSPEKLSMLHACQSIEISYATVKESQTPLQKQVKALYLIAWLASCIGWPKISLTEEDECLLLQFNRNDKKVTIEIKPMEHECFEVGEICHITINCEKNEKVEIIHDWKISKLKVLVTRSEFCETPFMFPLFDLRGRTNFFQQIFFSPTSNHYQRALQMLSQIHSPHN